METTTTIKLFQGKQLKQWVPTIAELRLSAFKEFPYLYAGSRDLEESYLNYYLSKQQSLFTLALSHESVIGATTGIPFLYVADWFSGSALLFEKNGYNPLEFYYYGELIVLPAYQRQGIASEMFYQSENFAKKEGYKHSCILTVERDKNHPQSSPDYKSNTQNLWRKLGFTKTSMHCYVNWPTFSISGEVVDMRHQLAFWIK